MFTLTFKQEHCRTSIADSGQKLYQLIGRHRLTDDDYIVVDIQSSLIRLKVVELPSLLSCDGR